MAKKKKLAKRGSLLKQLRSKRVLYGILILLLLLAGLKIYLHHRDIDHQAVQQKADYAVVDKQMQQVMTDIISTVGQPAEIHKSYGCGKTAAKFDEGHMTCSISYDFFVEVSSLDEAKPLTRAMLPVLHEQSASIFMIPNDENKISNSLVYDYDTSKPEIDCSLDYQFKDQAWFNGSDARLFGKKIASGYVARYSYGCGGPVVKAFYPVKKSE